MSEPEPYKCDCTYEGNKQIIGPNCQKEIERVWRKAIYLGTRMAKRVREKGIEGIYDADL